MCDWFVVLVLLLILEKDSEALSEGEISINQRIVVDMSESGDDERKPKKKRLKKSFSKLFLGKRGRPV